MSCPMLPISDVGVSATCKDNEDLAGVRRDDPRCDVMTPIET
jgi:hypothetical protein